MIRLLLNRVVLTAVSVLFVFCLSAGVAESGTIEVYVSVGITDDEGVPLRGDGGPASDMVQVIYAGPDGEPDLPGVDGAATGDDVLLELETVVGQYYARIGSGFPFNPNEGKFHADFRHNLSAGEKIYVRAWNAPSIDEATHYGDSALYAILGTVGESHDFAPPGAESWSTATEPPPGVGKDITPPDNVTNFEAVAGDRQVTLTWTNPTGPENADFARVMVVRKVGSYPEAPGDGKKIVWRDVESWTDVGLSNGTTYYYTAFAYDTSGNYASGVRASATPRAPAAPAAPDAACFIATAAYGTPLAGEVEVLKRFRDEHLLGNVWGRRLVSLYYRFSPPLARYISRQEMLKGPVRIALWPLVRIAEFMVRTGE